MQSMTRGMIGAYLRRLSARIDADTARVYDSLGVRFEQRWFGVLSQIAEGSKTVTEIASALRISHASVSETRRSLEGAGLLHAEPDPADTRRRRLSLTRKGSAFVDRMRPVWHAFEDAARELDVEVDGIEARLAKLEDALDRYPLVDRIMDRLK